MSEKYIIGVDEGSQSAKILILDLEGNLVCEGREPLKPNVLSGAGYVEHPDDDWWDAICKAGKKAMANFKGNKADIIGIGLCTIRFCRAYMKEDGTLAQPALSWMDIRVSKPHEDINKDAKYASASSGYITWRLTGKFRDSAGNYQGMWPMNTDTWNWLEDGEEFDSYGYQREMLPELVMPGEILGQVTAEAAEATGFPTGLPVVATANDQGVGALGVGCTGSDTAFISLGTYIPTMMQGEQNVKDAVNFWTNFSSVPNKYLYESHGIRRGMWTISWFKEVLGEGYINEAAKRGMSPEEYLSEEAAQVPAGCDGLMTVLDWLAPTDQIYKKGIMIGFDGRHKRAHMYRSIMEAIALTMKTKTDAMCEELGITLKHIIIGGGGSNSPLFMQIFADVFGIPARRNVINGAAGLGSAICAAVGLGVYKTFDEAIERMVKVKDEFTPVAEHVDLYGKMNKVYQDITKHTDPILERSYEIFQ